MAIFFTSSSVSLRSYNAFILPIPEYSSSAKESAANDHLQLLEDQVRAVARLCPDQCHMPPKHLRYVAELFMLYKVHSNSKHCLHTVRHDRAVVVAHLLELEVLRCWIYKSTRYVLNAQARMWNDLPSSLCDFDTFMNFREQLVVDCFPDLAYLSSLEHLCL